MSVSKLKANTLGPVNVYSLQLSVGLTTADEEYPARTDLIEDRFYRAVLSENFRYLKSSGGALTMYIGAQLIGGEGSGSTNELLYSRYMAVGEHTNNALSLQGNEWRAQQQRYAPGRRVIDNLPLILPPGMGFRLFGGSNEVLVDWSMMIAEAADPKHLWPFLSERRDGIAGNAE